MATHLQQRLSDSPLVRAVTHVEFDSHGGHTSPLALPSPSSHDAPTDPD